MTYDAAKKLASAAGRAKSDVANKLVAMALARVSQQVASSGAVRSEEYQEAVRNAFENRCPYCGVRLDADNTVLEHLDAMNQYRAGLHIQGNLLPACRACNQEKRRDDQAESIAAGGSGWEQFLSHDGSCGATCRTCAYWRSRIPDGRERRERLRESRRRIAEFRERYLPGAAEGLGVHLAPLLQELYREAQAYAEGQAEELVRAVLPMVKS